MQLSLLPRASTEEFRYPIGQPHDPNAPIYISVFLFISWTLVGLRTYCKGYILKLFGWDDIFMVLALVSTATTLANAAF
jgi:hypothetical protein